MNLKINLPALLMTFGLSFFPLLLVVGPLIAETYLVIIIILSLFYIIKEKKYFFFNNKFFFYFSLFYLSTLFSTLYNFYSLDASLSGIFFLRIPLFAIAVWYILETFNIFNQKNLYLFTIFLLIIIIDALIQYYTGKNILGYEISKNRISSFFGNELILGGFIIRVIPIFLVFLLMNNNVREDDLNLSYSTIISLLCSIVYLSGERTSFFLLILFFFVLFYFSNHLRKFVFLTLTLTLIFSLIFPKFQLNDELNPSKRMFTKTFNQIIGDGKNTEDHKRKIFDKIYIFSHDHQGHYLLAYKIFKDHPIFGTGVKGFRYLCRNKIYILEKNDGCSTHPHNTYVQILVSNGIIGFVILLFAFIFVIKEILKSKNKLNIQKKFNKNEISRGIILLAIFINLWPFVPSGNFFNNWISMIYFYPIGFYLYFNHLNEKEIN